MKVLFDTNIVLDVLLNREPFVELSAKLVSSVENKDIEGYLCATTITTLDYLIAKATSRKKANIEIQKLLNLFQIAEVNMMVLESSINSGFKGFEDAVQYFSAVYSDINALVTRNTKDYKQTKLAVYNPDELSKLISHMRYF